MAGTFTVGMFEDWIRQIDEGATVSESGLVQSLRDAHEAIGRVRVVHQPIDAVNYHGGKQHPTQVCTGCGTDDGNWQTYPCPTIRALEARR